jgi:uncharacterized protein (TIGR02246 family)
MSSNIASTVSGQDVVNSNPNERAIRAASREYVEAKRRGDMEALRKMWTSNGDYVNASGQAFTAQEAFREQVGAASSNLEPADVPVPQSSLRFITPEVAIEDGASEHRTLLDGTTLTCRFTAIWVKRDGRWLLDSLRESVAETSPFNEQLRPLEWLLGEWVGATDDAAILVSSHWSDDGQYIIREFLIRGDGRDDISATQRIGWDSSAEKIKCWTFDSQGNSGEGTWRRDGERWLVDAVEVLADGKKSKSSSVYVPGVDGQFVSEVKSDWASTDVAADSPKLPALRVEFKRALND